MIAVMYNLSVSIASLILFISITRSVSVQFEPSDRKVDVTDDGTYTFGLEYDPKVKISDCTVTSDTGIRYHFNVWPLYNESNFSVDTKINWIKDLGKEGLCQVLVSTVDDNGPKRWDLEARYYSEVVTKTSFTVQFSNWAHVHTSRITRYEYASFFNYLILPNDFEIDSCYVKINNKTVVDLDPHTPRINTKSEEILGRITSLGQGLCGLRYTNASQELHYVKWTLVATNRNGLSYIGNFTTIISNRTSLHFNKTVSLGQQYQLECPEVDSFCYIVNPNGERVQNSSCSYTIISVQMKDIGLWKCHTLSSESMETIETTIRLIIDSNNNVTWTNETEHYVNIGCQIFTYARNCRMITPNGEMLNVDTALATDRYIAFGTDLEKGICSIMISKPLQQFEKGSWKCELNRDFETVGATISVGEAKHTEYPKYFELRARLKRSLTIHCEVPYSTDYCRIISPKGDKYIPDKGKELSLGRCSHRIANVSIADRGEWTCMFSRETGLPDDKIVVNVTLGELLQHKPSVVSKVGGVAELLCKTDEEPLYYCRFSHGNKSYHIRDTDTNSSRHRISYFGNGLNYGECGIRISNLTRSDDGRWRCTTQLLPNDNREIWGGITLEVI